MDLLDQFLNAYGQAKRQIIDLPLIVDESMEPIVQELHVSDAIVEVPSFSDESLNNARIEQIDRTLDGNESITSQSNDEVTDENMQVLVPGAIFWLKNNSSFKPLTQPNKTNHYFLLFFTFHYLSFH